MAEELRIGDRAPDFNLPGVDGNTHSLADFDDKDVLVVIFSCNHCPYVQAYEDRIISLQDEFKDRGVVFVAINSNDDKNYPDDSFENMIKRAKHKRFNFHYLRDQSQGAARSYRATHTPQIFVFDSARILRYTGKIDDNWKEPGKVRERYLRDAIVALVEGNNIKNPETHAIGCTIKWAR